MEQLKDGFPWNLMCLWMALAEILRASSSDALRMTAWNGLGPARSVFVVGEDFIAIDVEGFFFVAGHEIDVELGDADFAEAV